jgi:hypothetical protein
VKSLIAQFIAACCTILIVVFAFSIFAERAVFYYNAEIETVEVAFEPKKEPAKDPAPRPSLAPLPEQQQIEEVVALREHKLRMLLTPEIKKEMEEKERAFEAKRRAIPTPTPDNAPPIDAKGDFVIRSVNSIDELPKTCDTANIRQRYLNVKDLGVFECAQKNSWRPAFDQ